MNSARTIGRLKLSSERPLLNASTRPRFEVTSDLDHVRIPSRSAVIERMVAFSRTAISGMPCSSAASAGAAKSRRGSYDRADRVQRQAFRGGRSRSSSATSRGALARPFRTRSSAASR